MLFGVIFVSKVPKSTRKAVFGALRARCPKALKKALRGPGPLGTFCMQMAAGIATLFKNLLMDLFRRSVNGGRRGAKGGKPRKIPHSTFLEAKGLLRRSLCPLVLRGRGPSKKRACFLEGAAWNFSWLAPLGPRPSRTVCEWWFPNGGSSLVRRANSPPPPV